MEVTVNERGASDQQPCAAPLVRLQAGQRWAGHPIDPTLSWPQVDCFDGSLHGARAGSVQGFLERLRKTHHRMRTAWPLPATAKDPRGDPRIIWVPYSRFRPIPSYAHGFHLLPPAPVTDELWLSGANRSYVD